MDKKKQIEEMEDIMNCSWNTKSAAVALYNAGYRKIDDDCAVITKDELKQYKVQEVKEFAEKVKMAFYYEFDEIIPSIMSDKIDELLKE